MQLLETKAEALELEIFSLMIQETIKMKIAGRSQTLGEEQISTTYPSVQHSLGMPLKKPWEASFRKSREQLVSLPKQKRKMNQTL